MNGEIAVPQMIPVTHWWLLRVYIRNITAKCETQKSDKKTTMDKYRSVHVYCCRRFNDSHS